MVAAQSLGLGSVFVGAIRNHPEQVAAELGLPPHAVATFGLAVGIPDPTEHASVKPRLPQSAVLHREQYDAAPADAHINVYDERLAAYNTRYGLPAATGPAGCSTAGRPGVDGRPAPAARDVERLGLPSR